MASPDRVTCAVCGKYLVVDKNPFSSLIKPSAHKAVCGLICPGGARGRSSQGRVVQHPVYGDIVVHSSFHSVDDCEACATPKSVRAQKSLDKKNRKRKSAGE